MWGDNRYNSVHISTKYKLYAALGLCGVWGVWYKTNDKKHKAMEITIEELTALTEASSNMKMRISELETEKTRLNEEIKRLTTELEWKSKELEVERSQGMALDLENRYLKTMLYLSVERIKVYMDHLTSMEQWAILRTFVSYTLPEQYRTEQMELVDKVMALPQGTAPQITVTDATFEAMYKISGNDEVNLGGSSNE